jgi:polysaccharide export outer membrane protein
VIFWGLTGRITLKWLLCLAVITGLGLLSPSVAQKVSDLTDEQIQQFIQQAKSTGLSESQIEQLALSRGFTQADLTAVRQRISNMAPRTPTEPVRAPDASDRIQSPDSPVPQPKDNPTPPAQTPAKAPDASDTPPVFGASLFSNTNLTFEPNLRIPTPKNYQLGPDDELIVDIFGNAQQTYRAKINPEGTIRLENLSPIYVSGLTVEQAEQRIVGRLRQLYMGLNTAGSGV